MLFMEMCIQDNGVFMGDMQMILIPNSNWKQSVVESAKRGTTNDQRCGTWCGFLFGYKSLRFYIARCRVSEPLPKQLSFSMPDMIVNINYLIKPSNGSQNLDFIIPPSTQQIVVWIQNSACRNNSKIPYSRFKLSIWRSKSNEYFWSLV
jgi:hypothetical protein